MFKIIITFIFLYSATLLAETATVDFENNTLAAWHTLGNWKITQEKKRKILSLRQRSDRDFNLCYTKELTFRNGEISVKFKANSGKIDQGGGLMWRVQDNDNYYVARFNPLEDNFRFYIVHDGIRSEIASANLSLPAGWHQMKIVQKNASFEGYIDGQKYLEAKDAHLDKAGGVGVWTKADALSSFDDLTVMTGE